MAKPYEISRLFAQLSPNMELLDKLWRKHPLEYLRTRLRAIRLLWQGYAPQEVVNELQIGHSTIIRWMRVLIDQGVDRGLHQLATPKTAPKDGKLSKVQQAALITIIEQKKPSDYGFEQTIFTAAILVEIVQREWNMTISDQTIYNVLRRNKFSYQRGHRDYEPTDPEEQHTYAEQLKKSLKRKKSTKKLSSLMNSGLRIDRASSTDGHA